MGIKSQMIIPVELEYYFDMEQRIVSRHNGFRFVSLQQESAGLQ
jgi:hypothetical protein